MPRRLYIETNFIISIANGQHEGNDKLIDAADNGLLEIALPQICIDEALSASVKDRERMQSFLAPLRPEVREYGRSRQSAASRAASSRLQSAILAIEKADGERLARLRTILTYLIKHAKLLPAVLSDIILDDELRRDPFDAIIAKAIADDNRVFGHRSILLTGNDDFDSPALRSTLLNAGVERVHHPEKVLARLRAQPQGEVDWQ